MSCPGTAQEQLPESVAAPSAMAEPLPPATWPASLVLHIGKTDNGTRLLASRHHGPLYVQKPFYPEGPDLPHIYLLHPPGGMVSGDHLKTELNLDAQSMALFTTPGAARMYRARADRNLQQQEVCLNLGTSASVEWLPGETIFYPGTCGRNTTRINLAGNSHVIGWEINCIGLPVSGMPFDDGVISQRFEIFRAGIPQFIDHLRLDTRQELVLQGSAGLAGNTVSALLVAGPFATGSYTQSLLDRVRALLGEELDLLGATLVNGYLAIRYLGNCAWQARQCFIRCWQVLRPALLGRDACLPRIWAT